MISTHILDLHSGNPAANVAVLLERLHGGEWQRINEERTNADGRISFNNPALAGEYRLTFQIEEYLRAKSSEPFFPSAPITFRITDTGRKYHIPLLLSPFGYSTYRGS